MQQPQSALVAEKPKDSGCIETPVSFAACDLNFGTVNGLCAVLPVTH